MKKTENNIPSAPAASSSREGRDSIVWTGDNLKDVLTFTGVSPLFSKWFRSFEEYEGYVRSHGNVFKLFNDDGSHWEVPVSATLTRTAGGKVIPSAGVFQGRK